VIDGMLDDTTEHGRRGRFTVYRRADVDTDALLQAVASEGTILKESHKSITRRVGPWVVKTGLPTVRRAFWRRRYTQAWRASLHLARAGVGVARPRAFVEERRLGFIFRDHLITDYLDGYHSVEDHARRLVNQQASPESIADFLGRLADSIVALVAAGACHRDLSGKNIYTSTDGDAFAFIDLDSVVLNSPCSRAMRLKNHVQLYDSFCDLWGPDVLDPFIRCLGFGCRVDAAWLERVRLGQCQRRATHRAKQMRRPGS